MKNLLHAWTAAMVAGAVLMGCSGDDNGGKAPGTDAGNDGTTPATDGFVPGSDAADSGGGLDGVAPTADAAADAVASGDAGPCNFATFVKGLVANDTTATALPSTDLGQACVDNQNQAEFRSLFP